MAKKQAPRHTPGPIEVDRYSSYAVLWREMTEQEKEAEMQALRRTRSDWRSHYAGKMRKLVAADVPLELAPLFAAAPEQNASLREVVLCFGSGPDSEAWWSARADDGLTSDEVRAQVLANARAAIAKAEGQP